jgi:hypothetical protein
MESGPISAAAVLKLIRDKAAVTEADLLEHLRVGRWFISHSVLARELRKTLHGLLEANLICENRELQFETTAVSERVTSALDISLTELSSWDCSAIVGHPIFGRPKPPDHELLDIFVAMPFSSGLQPIYDDHICTVCSSLAVSVGRADDFYAAGTIMNQIWAAIYFSKIVVADCTGRNPNVFYEIGVCHTLGRPTILLAQTIDDVPFDLRHLRYIIYAYTPRGMKAFEADLTKALRCELADLSDS